MIVFTEGNLEITINHEINARKFDDPIHGLSHCMKAVDFVIELDDCYQFIEIKDPQNPGAPTGTDIQYAQTLLSGGIAEDLRYKYRDSFLYEWASGRAEKPVDYLVLVALDLLSEPELSIVNDMLERNVPLHGPGSTPWPRPIVRSCGVFNIASWNRSFPDYPVRRLS